MRWLVERRQDVFEDYGYEHMSVLDCGAVKFYDGSPLAPKNTLVLAAGQWISVCEDSA